MVVKRQHHRSVKTMYVKLATVVEAEYKAYFSIATPSMCGGGRYSFPWIALLCP